MGIEADSLVSKQALFASLLARLILHIQDRGWRCTLGEGYLMNPRRTRGGESMLDGVHRHNSLHYLRLACDLNLFIGDKFISDGSHPAWAELGEWWKAQHELCAWGGDWSDANHFSLTHGGRK